MGKIEIKGYGAKTNPNRKSPTKGVVCF